MKESIKEAIRFTIKNLGLVTIFTLIVVMLSRGTNPVSQSTAMLVASLICVPMIFLQVWVIYNTRPNRLLARLARQDVLLSSLCVIVYVTLSSGLLDGIN